MNKNFIKKFYYRLFINQKGFGMVELVITIVILGFGLFSLLNLMSFLVRADRINKIDFIALNLARQGVEVIRNIRDSNWLSGKKWDDGLSLGNDYSGIVDFDLNTNKWKVDFLPNSIDDNYTKLYFNEKEKIYTHQPIGKYTNFRRILKLKSICYDYFESKEIIKDSGNFCSGNEKKVGIYIVSLVAYQNGDFKREVKLVDKIYNWR